MEFKHYSVLLEESIEALQIKGDGTYVDCTVGGAGHSIHIVKRLTKKGRLFGFDQDSVAIETARERLSYFSPEIHLIHANFINMKTELMIRGVKAIDGIIFDLGVSSKQLDDGERGFSYNYDAKLDMRMDRRQTLDAYTVVNSYNEKELADIIYRYSDEKFSRQIASKIVEARSKKAITTTFELVSVIKSAVPFYGHTEGHPAKRTFQALRIEVNQELGILEFALRDALSILNKGGRLVVITFHSLEDKIVKDLFKEKTSPPVWKRGMPVTNETVEPEFRLITKKPMEASEKELLENHRSHSAKLRIIEKI